MSIRTSLWDKKSWELRWTKLLLATAIVFVGLACSRPGISLEAMVSTKGFKFWDYCNNEKGECGNSGIKFNKDFSCQEYYYPQNKKFPFRYFNDEYTYIDQIAQKKWRLDIEDSILWIYGRKNKIISFSEDSIVLFYQGITDGYHIKLKPSSNQTENPVPLPDGDIVPE